MDSVTEKLRADDLRWTLPPLNPLMFDDDTMWLADTLRESITQVRALTVQCDRQSARILSLIAELRTVRAEAQGLRAQIRAMQDLAA
jgi:hypothetical protein